MKPFSAVDEPLPEPEPDPEPCQYLERLGSYYDAPEWCEEDALPGSDFCHRHDPDAEDDLRISLAEDRRDGLV